MNAPPVYWFNPEHTQVSFDILETKDIQTKAEWNAGYSSAKIPKFCYFSSFILWIKFGAK